MHYKNDIEFDTLEKLKTQIGHYVYFSVGKGGTYYAWIVKVTKVSGRENTQLNIIPSAIYGICVLGTQHVYLYAQGKINEEQKPLPNGNINYESLSNVQWAARKPTQEEMKLYKTLWRKKIFVPNKSQ